MENKDIIRYMKESKNMYDESTQLIKDLQRRSFFVQKGEVKLGYSATMNKIEISTSTQAGITFLPKSFENLLEAMEEFKQYINGEQK
jgi:hypothetical protein